MIFIIDLINKILKKENLIYGITDNKRLNLHKDLLDNTPFVNYPYEERVNPLATMSNCKSIIVVGMGYSITSNEDKTKPYVSSGYLDYDYHKVLKNKLQLIVDELSSFSPFDYKIFVDTGPLVERELAKKSGLGFYGKNYSIISEKFGSAFFIGYIMTDLELTPTKSINKNCGNCKKCIEACPTKILSKVDNKFIFKKCCSYLTQKKEPLSPYEESVLSNKLYGCDDCIRACPYNYKQQSEAKNPLNFSTINNLSNKKFKETFQNTGFFWRGATTIKRNGNIGLNNSKI